MPYKHDESRRHKIPKARYRVENWREYDAALRDRGSLTVWVTPEAIAAWHPARTGRPGRSAHYSDLAIETGVMLRRAFARPWRQTEGLLRSVTTLLGLSLDVPDHTTLSRRSAALSLVTALAVPAGPVTVLIDSTGLKVFGAGEWRMAKHGGRDRRTWRKLHLAIDPDTGEVLASALTTTEEGDASLVRPLLDQIAAPIAAVLADGAYDGDPVYRAVADRAPTATVIIPPRATAVVSEVSAAGTPTPRDRHIEMIAAKGRLGWQKAVGYGRRSLVETRNRSAILAAVLADATNLGPKRMAEASSNVSERQISWARLFHVRPETYRAAQAAIIDAHSAHPHATLWGAGATSSSDGQFFRASDRAAGRSDVNLHYGSEPGTKFYSHLSDQYGYFSILPISPSESEAPYVLDGLFDHESKLDIDEHYTDTGGSSDHVFGLFALLGRRFEAEASRWAK